MLSSDDETRVRIQLDDAICELLASGMDEAELREFVDEVIERAHEEA